MQWFIYQVALVILSHQLEMIPNTYFIYPLPESIIEPARDLLNENNAPIYKSMTFGEFNLNFFNKGPKIESELQS
ncbi:putative isopenicillin N synthase [Lupinus albus]|uniref:Putative isopenicillin N synthase n=1 Tax=Lupinus albus TaxID=3870 RepID=A0A6A4QGN3_LUPAL|nr:putative isopenicillin N synthase [Lupinus albus]